MITRTVFCVKPQLQLRMFLFRYHKLRRRRNLLIFLSKGRGGGQPVTLMDMVKKCTHCWNPLVNAWSRIMLGKKCKIRAGSNIFQRNQCLEASHCPRSALLYSTASHWFYRNPSLTFLSKNSILLKKLTQARTLWQKRRL